MLGVLEVILRGDPVTTLGFSTSQRKIMLVVSLCVLRRHQGAGKPGRFGFPGLSSA
jgi:hypothetical protein